MSFFDDASLAFLPSGAAGKDGKAYSIKPTDGTGDFTFSRGSNLAATRVGADGLIEKGRENLIKQSNNFNTSEWTRGNFSFLENQADKDGGTTAWKATCSTTYNYLGQDISGGGVYTFSGYFRKGDSDEGVRFNFSASTDTNVYIDLTDGSSTDNGNLIYKSITDAGNGYYKVVVAANLSSLASVRFFITNGGTTQVAGNIYIEDFQLEIGLAATDYIESGATTGKAGLLEDEPRFDYSGGATCPSLLLEPSRTNLIPQSEYFGDSSWFKGNVVVTTNSVVSPEGVQNGTKVDFLAIANANIQRSPATPTTIGVDYTISFYARADAPVNNVKISSVGGDTDLTITTSWQRFTRKITATATSTGTTLVTRDSVATTIYLYGFQLEAGSYPTSYIPNHSGGSVTRGEDLLGALVIDELANNYTISLDVTRIANDGDSHSTFMEMKANSPLDGEIEIRAQNSGRLRFRFSDDSDTLETLYTSPNSFTQGNLSKIAIRYNGNEFETFVNGVSEIVTSNIGATTLNRIQYIGSLGALSRIMLFPEALSDADCITLTT